MSTFQILLILLAVVVGLPILAYMVVKFGATGYFNAKRRQDNKNKTKDKTYES